MDARREVTDVLRRLYRRLYGYPDPAEHSYLAQLRREVTLLRSSVERTGGPSEDLAAEVDRLAGRVEEYVGAHPPRPLSRAVEPRRESPPVASRR